MIIHNIYIINSEGICPLSLTLGSIDADPELVAGIFTASQKFWSEVTGETPQSISFKNMNAYIKPFSTGEKDWYLILISEAEKPELVKKVEDCILKIVEQNKKLFEKFFADTTDINNIVGELIIDEIAQIPCPHIRKGLLKTVCEIDNKPIEERYCNFVSMATCKTKIREYSKQDSSIVGLFDKFFDSLR
ncbi:MAG: hypothetical protein ACUVXA_09125 [Candidatus Jordarchaeum sp.]|uniref:hypothetical protein n=1 Tax=Candidatus Jordarchaeum sp. TaxID=2823881 RepID=UPI004049BA83